MSIIDSIRFDNSLGWATLSLVDEAKIQYKLRQLGYELTCVDQWPTTVNEFKLIIEDYSPSKLIKNKIQIVPIVAQKIVSKLSQTFVVKFGYLIFCLVMLGYYHDWIMLAQGALFGYLMWAWVEFADHDYMEHRYVVPKNKVIKHFVEYLCYIFMPATYANKIESIRLHTYHHIYWKGEKDKYTQSINDIPVPGFFNPPLFTKPNAKNMQRLLNEYPEFPYIVKYFREIEILISLIVIATLGFKFYFFFFLIPILIRPPLQAQHDFWLTNLGERDHYLLFPLALNQAWHVTHHNNFRIVPKTWSEVFNGPWWVKYVNPQYYFGRLFFKLRYRDK